MALSLRRDRAGPADEKRCPKARQRPTVGLRWLNGTAVADAVVPRFASGRRRLAAAHWIAAQAVRFFARGLRGLVGQHAAFANLLDAAAERFGIGLARGSLGATGREHGQDECENAHRSTVTPLGTGDRDRRAIRDVGPTRRENFDRVVFRRDGELSAEDRRRRECTVNVARAGATHFDREP